MTETLQPQQEASEKDKLIEAKDTPTVKCVEKHERETQTMSMSALTIEDGGGGGDGDGNRSSALKSSSEGEEKLTGGKCDKQLSRSDYQSANVAHGGDGDESEAETSSMSAASTTSSETTRQRNNNTIMCRICHCEETSEEYLIAPCYCSGTLRYVHQSCLQQWLKSRSSLWRKTKPVSSLGHIIKYGYF